MTIDKKKLEFTSTKRTFSIMAMVANIESGFRIEFKNTIQRLKHKIAG